MEIVGGLGIDLVTLAAMLGRWFCDTPTQPRATRHKPCDAWRRG